MRKIPRVYQKVHYKKTGTLVFENKSQEETLEDTSMLVVEDVPDYFEIKENIVPKGVKRVKVKQYPGFMIDFEGVKDLDYYLKLRFGKSSRYKLKRDKKKLEQCFDISYKMYFGDISKKDYDFLFDHLYRLLEYRSSEKGIKNNVNFKERELYQRRTFPMILEKKASLFVIYNGDQPIDICLNFHLRNLIYQHIRTYDIAYSKFNVGYTDLMKQIEWCIENKILAMVFSKGDYYWKRRWCNTVYDYYFHFYYKRKNLFEIISAYQIIFLRRLRQKAREWGVIEKYHSYKIEKIRKRNEREEPTLMALAFKEECQYINWDVLEYNKAELFIQRAINNFLYQTNQHQQQIQIYTYKEKKLNLFIKGISESVLYKVNYPE